MDTPSFSLFYSSPAQLGDARDDFEWSLRLALHDLNPAGPDEAIRIEAISART